MKKQKLDELRKERKFGVPENIDYLGLQVIVNSSWLNTVIVRPDPNQSYGQYFLQIQLRQ